MNEEEIIKLQQEFEDMPEKCDSKYVKSRTILATSLWIIGITISLVSISITWAMNTSRELNTNTTKTIEIERKVIAIEQKYDKIDDKLDMIITKLK